MPNASAIRLLFAVVPDDAARAALGDACAAMRRETVPGFARWTHPSDYHVTVKFLGDVEPALAARRRYCGAASRQTTGRTART